MRSCNDAAGEKFFQRGAPAGRSPPLTRVPEEARPPLALPLFSKHLDYPLILLPPLLFMNTIIKSRDVSKVLAGNASTKSTFL
jgi:hypothetical protein